MNRPNSKRLATQRSHSDSRSPERNTRHILIVAVPPVRTLDVFGPLEVFGDANRLRSDGPTYEISVVSAGTDRDVLSHLGLPVHTDQTYGEYCGPIDTILVAGYDGVSKVRYERNFLNWLKESCATSPAFWFGLHRRAGPG
jgi:transcriptional regulator GlxA family with amidase domain